MNQTKTVKEPAYTVYSSVSDMKGVGEEWLAPNGNIIAIFIDGNRKCVVLYPYFDEATKAFA